MEFLASKTIIVSVNQDDEILKLRHNIALKRSNRSQALIEYAVRYPDQYLTFQSKPLHDSFTVRDYGIQHGSTLLMSGRQRGGCFMISLSILFTILIAISMSFCTCGLSLTIVPFLLPFLAVLPLFCL